MQIGAAEMRSLKTESSMIDLLKGLCENGPCSLSSPHNIEMCRQTLQPLGLIDILSEFPYSYKKCVCLDEAFEQAIESIETGILVIITDKGKLYVKLEKL